MTSTGKCVHHWMLEPGNHRVPGRCKHCGDTRIFEGQPMDALRMTTGNSPGERPPTAEEERIAVQSRAKGGLAAAAAKRARERDAARLLHQLAREEARGL